ncbi:MAG: amidohydrolase family protein [Bacteroidota bacterium]
MVIDSHLHVGLMGTTEAGLLRYLDHSKIDRCWLLTWEEEHPPVPAFYQPLDLNEVRRVWKNHPDRILPFYAPDPSRKTWKDDLQRCLDEGFAGCGELKVSRNWNDPLIRDLLAFLDDRKLPLVFHSEQPRTVFLPGGRKLSDGIYRRLINERFNGDSARYILQLYAKGRLKRQLDGRLTGIPGYLDGFNELEQALLDFPNICFVAHGPNFWNHFSTRMYPHRFHETGEVHEKGLIWDLLEKYPNLRCDMSGFSAWNALQRDVELTCEFMEKFSLKILFGTDNFSFNQKKFLEKLNISDFARNRILGANAAALLP